MCSVSRWWPIVLIAACTRDVPVATDGAIAESTLRVCADPNNLPFSNAAEQGFENKLAALVAADLGWSVSYTWRPQRRGFIRETLKAKQCDVVMGVPAGYEMTATTKPYYRSGYVLVTRADGPALTGSLDDEALRTLRIGLHAIGDDYANVPPAQALAERGLSDRIVGYSIYGDYSKPNPPADLLRGLEKGEVDVAIAWGPLAGDFVAHTDSRLRITPITDTARGMQFSIAMGTRRDDQALRTRLDDVIARRRVEIDHLLDQYGLPRMERAR